MSQEMLRRLGRRELGPREIADLLRHIGECATCAHTSAADVDAELAALRPALVSDEGPWHPDHSDVAAYAVGTAGPAVREIVESHLEDCRLCREDVADLAKLRPPRARWSPWRTTLAAAAAAALAAVVILQQSDDRPEPPILTATTAVAGANQPTATATTTATPPEPEPSTTNAAPQLPKYANAEWERLVHNAVESERLPFASGLQTSPDILRGPDDETGSKVSPSGVVVDETRPRFSWPKREGATFVVSVFSGDQQVAKSETTTATSWTPAAALPRGRTYVWQVEATRDARREIIPAPPAPPATFRIVSKRDHDDLAAARRLHPDDHLLHAVLAARAGLRDEALASLSRADTNIRPR